MIAGVPLFLLFAVFLSSPDPEPAQATETRSPRAAPQPRAMPPDPAVHCGTATTSYRFTGVPGQAFTYEGDEYRIPQSGWIELIAGSEVTYRIASKTLPLDVWPRDPFGTRAVQLPAPQEQPHDH